jgi:hypothetical protein
MSPVTSSQLRKGMTSASKSKIKSNLNTTIISTPVFSKDLNKS